MYSEDEEDIVVLLCFQGTGTSLGLGICAIAQLLMVRFPRFLRERRCRIPSCRRLMREIQNLAAVYLACLVLRGLILVWRRYD
jgi:hypothetical protein